MLYFIACFVEGKSERAHSYLPNQFVQILRKIWTFIRGNYWMYSYESSSQHSVFLI